LNRIRSAVKNLTGILNDFLSLERMDSGLMELYYQKIDMVEYIEDILDELSSIKKTGQSFTLKHNKLNPFVCDSKLLKNILINLMSNAIKYSKENSNIVIELSQNKLDLSIIIQDQGIGIPKAEQTHLFERFFRAKNAFNIQGTGLGLHIVHKYVTLLEGSINLESEEERGTKVTLTLPNGKEENISN
jgi:signal transduction histidine kinase